MIAPGLELRGVTPPLQLADYKLVAFDMDSTLINIECIDEIADAAGRKAEVAAITEAAMRGEIPDFKESLRRRLALFGDAYPQRNFAILYRLGQQLTPERGILITGVLGRADFERQHLRAGDRMCGRGHRRGFAVEVKRDRAGFPRLL